MGAGSSTPTFADEEKEEDSPLTTPVSGNAEKIALELAELAKDPNKREFFLEQVDRAEDVGILDEVIEADRKTRSISNNARTNFNHLLLEDIYGKGFSLSSGVLFMAPSYDFVSFLKSTTIWKSEAKLLGLESFLMAFSMGDFEIAEFLLDNVDQVAIQWGVMSIDQRTSFVDKKEKQLDLLEQVKKKTNLNWNNVSFASSSNIGNMSIDEREVGARLAYWSIKNNKLLNVYGNQWVEIRDEIKKMSKDQQPPGVKDMTAVNPNLMAKLDLWMAMRLLDNKIWDPYEFERVRNGEKSFGVSTTTKNSFVKDLMEDNQLYYVLAVKVANSGDYRQRFLTQEGNTILISAIANDNYAQALILLEKGSGDKLGVLTKTSMQYMNCNPVLLLVSKNYDLVDSDDRKLDFLQNGEKPTTVNILESMSKHQEFQMAINMTTKNGYNAFDIACLHRNLDALKILLRGGFESKAMDKGRALWMLPWDLTNFWQEVTEIGVRIYKNEANFATTRKIMLHKAIPKDHVMKYDESLKNAKEVYAKAKNELTTVSGHTKNDEFLEAYKEYVDRIDSSILIKEDAASILRQFNGGHMRYDVLGKREKSKDPDIIDAARNEVDNELSVSWVSLKNDITKNDIESLKIKLQSPADKKNAMTYESIKGENVTNKFGLVAISIRLGLYDISKMLLKYGLSPSPPKRCLSMLLCMPQTVNGITATDILNLIPENTFIFLKSSSDDFMKIALLWRNPTPFFEVIRPEWLKPKSNTELLKRYNELFVSEDEFKKQITKIIDEETGTSVEYNKIFAFPEKRHELDGTYGKSLSILCYPTKEFYNDVFQNDWNEIVKSTKDEDPRAKVLFDHWAYAAARYPYNFKDADIKNKGIMTDLTRNHDLKDMAVTIFRRVLNSEKNLTTVRVKGGILPFFDAIDHDSFEVANSMVPYFKKYKEGEDSPTPFHAENKRFDIYTGRELSGISAIHLLVAKNYLIDKTKGVLETNTYTDKKPTYEYTREILERCLELNYEFASEILVEPVIDLNLKDPWKPFSILDLAFLHRDSWLCKSLIQRTDVSTVDVKQLKRLWLLEWDSTGLIETITSLLEENVEIRTFFLKNWIKCLPANKRDFESYKKYFREEYAKLHVASNEGLEEVLDNYLKYIEDDINVNELDAVSILGPVMGMAPRMEPSSRDKVTEEDFMKLEEMILSKK